MNEPKSATFSESLQEFSELLHIVARLRGPGGCPWDIKQTQKSLTRYIIEEAYELVDAIDSQDQVHIQEELGDYLFQVILQAQVAQDENLFVITDVLRRLNAKMVRRHPHVFAGQKAETPEEVKEQWATIKAEEKKLAALERNGKPETSRLAKELQGFPALLTALKIGHRSEEWKFDWDTAEQVEAKVMEEFHEVKEAASAQDQDHLEEEVGDLLFAVAQWARHLKVDPETALRKGNLKFEKRFHEMLKISGLDQQSFAALPLSEKELFWARAKKIVTSKNI